MPYSGKLSREKTFTGGSKTAEFVNVFESFPLYGRSYVVLILAIQCKNDS